MSTDYALPYVLCDKPSIIIIIICVVLRETLPPHTQSPPPHAPPPLCLRFPFPFTDFELPLGRRARVQRTGHCPGSWLHGRVGQSLGFILSRSAPRAVHSRASP